MKNIISIFFIAIYVSFLIVPFLPKIESKIENDLCSLELIHSSNCVHNDTTDLRNTDVCFLDAIKSRVETNKFGGKSKTIPSTQTQVVIGVHITIQKYYLNKNIASQNRKFADKSFIIKDILNTTPTPPPKC